MLDLWSRATWAVLRVRKMTWALAAWCWLTVVWAVVSARAADCGDDGVCAGAVVGPLVVGGVGFSGFMVLLFVWYLTRPRRRMCPHCGYEAKKGWRDCKSCGFDFTSLASLP